MKNLKHVFSFTFIQKVRQKGYITATVLLAILFLVLPAAIMVIADNVGEDAPPTVKTETVFVYDSTDGDADYSVLSPDKKITYQMADTLEDALKAAEKVPYALVLQVKKDKLSLLLPENSLATKEEAEVLSAEIKGLFPLILAQKAGISQEQLLGLSTPSEILTPSGETSPEEESEQLRQIIAMVAPMLVLFLMYFMVLLYGQSTANSAIMEKSSKLMDTFLLSVKPETMMLGKVFATAVANFFDFHGKCWKRNRTCPQSRKRSCHSFAPFLNEGTGKGHRSSRSCRRTACDRCGALPLLLACSHRRSIGIQAGGSGADQLYLYPHAGTELCSES